MPQPLNSKEASLFRQVVKNYESKQHKKGIKAADQILRKVPNHGDTQAMKALILNTMGNSDEAFALAKTALRNDMKSHVCWHVYGLLWRSQKNFDEAIRAYRMALNLEPESPQILRDLSLLQVQMRDFGGYVQSRHKMLLKREGFRQNWTALAIAHHLNGDLKEAERVLKLFEGTLKMEPSVRDIEHNEAVLYRNTIIAEMGDTERALEHLESIEKKTLDKTAAMEMRAQYLLRLKKMEDAEEAYRALIARNGENREYYNGLEQALEITKDDKQRRRDLYAELVEKDEAVDAARRIPLDFLEGDSFREAVDAYLRRMLRKGVPSTFNNVKSLYHDPAKRKVIEALVESYKTEQLQMNGDANGRAESSNWEKSVLYFLAQHYNFKLTRDLQKATTYTDRLIELAPKTYDWHMTKARIYKHQGRPSEAATQMNTARELDLRDRWINSKCAKYQLRNNCNDLAISTMSKFTRNEVIGGTLGDLIEMQALWYLTEDGEAYMRQGRYGLALKRLLTVWNIFEQWQEDQFDFHTFSLRKAQIRAYIDMLRWEDRLRSHPYYTRASLDAIKVYLSLHEKPSLASISDLPKGLDPALASDSKAVKKARQEEDKAEAVQREADRKAAAKRNNLGQDGEVKKTDDDPKGLKLVNTKTPLEDALKFLTPLVEFGERNLEVQKVAFEVYIRRKKLFLALRHLLAAYAIDKEDPELHALAVRFRYDLSRTSDAPAQVRTLVEQYLPQPYNGTSAAKDLPTINEAFLKQHTGCLGHACAYVKAARVLKSEEKANAKVLVDALAKEKQLGLEDVENAVLVVMECGGDKGEAMKVVEKGVDVLGFGRERLERATAAVR